MNHFFTKFSSAVTWEESRDHTLKFMRTVTSISAALHVCNKFDLSMRGLSIHHSVLIMHGASLVMSMIGYLCLNLNMFFSNLIFLFTILLAIFGIIILDRDFQ